MKLAERYLKKLEETRDVSSFVDWDVNSSKKKWMLESNGIKVTLNKDFGIYMGKITNTQYPQKVIGNTMLESKGEGIYTSKKILDGPAMVFVEAKYLGNKPESVSYKLSFNKGTDWNQVTTLMEKYLSIMDVMLSK